MTLPKLWIEKIEADADQVGTEFESVYIRGATQWAEQCEKLAQALKQVDEFYADDRSRTVTILNAIAELEKFLKGEI